MVDPTMCRLIAEVDQLRAAVRDASDQLVQLFAAKLTDLRGDVRELS